MTNAFTNEEIIEAFECVEDPPLELIQDAYIARDFTMFGENANSNEHLHNREQILEKYKRYFTTQEHEDKLDLLTSYSLNGDIYSFYKSLTQIELYVLGF